MVSPELERDPAERRNELRVAAVVAIAIVVVFAARHWRGGPLAESDDYAQYILHAQALLHGKAYWETGYIYSPRADWVGPLNYPPGLPLTLLPLLAVFRWTSPVFELLMLGFVAALGVVTYRYFRRYGDPVIAAFSVVLALVALLELDVQGAVGSDVGFMALAWGACLVADHPGPWSTRRFLGVTLLGLLAISYRLAAAPLVPAILVVGFLRRKELGWKPVIAALLWTAALVAVFKFQTVGAVGSPRPNNPLGGNVTHVPPSAAVVNLIKLAWSRLVEYRIGVAESFVSPFGSGHDGWYKAGAAILMFIGLARYAFDARRSLGLWLVLASTGMVLISFLVGDRYVWVLFPALTFGILSGVVVVLNLLGKILGLPKLQRARYLVAGAGVLVALVFRLRTTPREATAANHRALELRAELFDALQAMNTRGDRRVMFDKPKQLSLRTGIPAMGPNSTRDVTLFLDVISYYRITDVVLRKERHGDVSMLRSRVMAAGDRFHLAFSVADFDVYSVGAGDSTVANGNRSGRFDSGSNR